VPRRRTYPPGAFVNSSTPQNTSHSFDFIKMRSFHPLIVTLCVTAGAYGQSQKEYDYIICGAGTAGLTVANRLTQDGKTTVLVVEPGTNNTVQDWGYQSQPQKYAKDTVAYLPAGKAVGGSSKVNGEAMICTPDPR
jgi:hypothetical protein